MNFGTQPATVLARGSTGQPSSSWGSSGARLTVPRTDSPKWGRFGPLAAVLALGAAGFFAFSSSDTDTFEPVTEPAVNAADLPLGSMFHVVDQIGARALWAQGITGAGVNVAVIDTGIAPVDGLLDSDKVVAAVDLSSEGADQATAFVDANGHGTHLAGIIAGRETGADPALAEQHPEWFLGVAPDAGIVSVKVGDRNGDVLPGGLVAGVDWVVDNSAALDIRVINLAVGTPSNLPYENDPLAAAVERAWDAGIVVVTAAGNDGADANGLLTPANDPYVIAVAGADVSESGINVADWSSSGDGVRNPDLSAPGAHIESLRAPGSDADVNHADTGYVDAETFRGSGSSQAAAIVAGSAALLLDARPDLTNDQVKAILTDTTTPLAAESQVAGSGLVDVAAANSAAAPVATQTFSEAAVDTSVSQEPLTAYIWFPEAWSGASWSGASWSGASWSGAS
ncbi:MAG: S8 family serine peptidase, partial [Actinobacteria bacterium]|nr:S8 family serine peptidase [Actinomycetota bacterium]